MKPIYKSMNMSWGNTSNTGYIYAYLSIHLKYTYVHLNVTYITESE